MANTTFTSGTTITSGWLNDVNDFVYAGGSSTNEDPGPSGFWPDVTSTTIIRRQRDRLFVGGGAAFTGNRSGTQGGFVPTSTEGANWASRDSMFFTATDQGRIAIAGFASNDDMDLTGGEPTETIGVGGFVIGNQAGRSAWGLYSDVQYEAGLSGWGVEMAIKNKSGVDSIATPYFFVSGACGAWIVAGGDASYGGASTNPSNFAVGIGANDNTWNTGILVFGDAITRDGSGYGYAMQMGYKHRVVWRTETNAIGFDVRSEVTGTGNNVAVIGVDNAVQITGPGGLRIAQFNHTASSVNYLSVTSGAAGSPVTLQTAGGTDIDFRIITSGTGVMRFGTWTSNADVAVNGYVTIKDSAGNVRKLATIA